MFKETKRRSIVKTITWRLFAILNSWGVLVLVVDASNVLKALSMNITGFFIFYFFERIWNKIKWGKIDD